MGNHRESVLRLWSSPSVATARGSITPSSLSSLWGLWPSLTGVMDSFLVPFVIVEHARVDVPTPYPALRDASRLAICTVGNPPSSVNTRLLVMDYRRSSCPGGSALWYCTLSWVAVSVRWLSRSCDPVSVLRVYTSRLFGEPSSSRFPRVGSACTVLLRPSLADTLSAPSAGTLLPFTIAGTSTAEWLSSPGDSPRPPPAPAIYSTVANLVTRLGWIMV